MLFHLDQVQSVAVAVACFDCEKPHFHRKSKGIVAEDEELWIVDEYLKFNVFVGEKKINKIGIIQPNRQIQVKGKIYTTPKLS